MNSNSIRYAHELQNANWAWPYVFASKIKELTTTTTLEEIQPIIRNIKTHKGSGVAHISTHVLKDALTELPLHLLHVINLSITRNEFPDSWKTATVTPLPKGGNPSEVNNLRPISILPLISKICEKVVHSQVLTYLTSENILTAKQHGFRPSHSTITSLTELTDQIYKAIDNKLVTLVTYLDFAKAFDTINHDLLSQKLRKIGLAEASVSWFKSYLTNRLQMTKANGVTSLPGRITCGVPQGSILGPLLFLIYINDLPTSLTSLQCQLYADDTALYTPCKFPDPDIVPRINADLLNVANWCKKNKLSLNIKKTKYTVYGTRQQIAILPQLNFSIDGQAILQTPHYRYLGLELDSHLNFKSHLNTSQKAYVINHI